MEDNPFTLIALSTLFGLDFMHYTLEQGACSLLMLVSCSNNPVHIAIKSDLPGKTISCLEERTSVI